MWGGSPASGALPPGARVDNAIDAAGGDFDSNFDRAAVRLMSDPATRARLTAASLEVCDGLGAPRVAEAFLEAIAKRA